MNTSTNLQRILVLDGPGLHESGTLDQLRQRYDVFLAKNMEEAMGALRGGSFDAVLSDTTEFLPLDRALASQQSTLILDTIGEGVCLVSQAGRLLWTNRRMRQWDEFVQQHIVRTCQEAYRWFVTVPGTDPGQGAAPVRSRKFGINIDDTRFFELVCSPVLDPHGQVRHVVAVCWDASSTRRLQQKIDAIDQAGQELARLEEEAISRLNVMERLHLLEEKIIKFCRQLMHFDHFSIRLLDRTTNKLEPVITVGMPPEAAEIELFALPEGNGISGHVAATGRSYIAPDVQRDPRYIAGLDLARSSLTVPLMLRDRVIGIFNIESKTYGFFTEDDRQFAEIFGRYVALALNILDLLVVERCITSGRLVQDVAGEIAQPLNDISTDVALLREHYIGNDEMLQRLTDITTNVARIRESLHAVTQGPRTILGHTEQLLTPPDPRLVGKRILIADDQPAIRDTIKDILGRCGCLLDTAMDGAQAVALLSSQARYDLVISDIQMPHKNGYEIYSAAQRLGHKPPVILMTGFGYDPSHSIVRASQEGLAAVLFKPFKIDQLMNQILAALATDGSAESHRP